MGARRADHTKIAYVGHYHLLDIRTDTNGVQIAYANQVA